MKTMTSIGAVAIFLASPLAQAGMAQAEMAQAQAHTFPTGKSYYGIPAPAGNYRTIDLSRGDPINVVCGEVVNFTSQGRTFAWKVSSIQHNKVPVSRFAPAGFNAQDRAIYIAPGEHEQGG